MKKLATILFAALCAISSAEETPISVNLSISRPQASESKTESKPKSNRHGRSSSRTSTETKNSIYSYTGKVGCNLPKDATATVTVEAYFITRSVGGKGAKDVLSPRNEIDKFVFGGDNPASYAFSLTSPQFAQTTVTTVKTSRSRRRHGGGGSSSTTKDKSGTRLMGVVVRALVDGKPVKVVSEPSNSRWITAAKKPSFELE